MGRRLCARRDCVAAGCRGAACHRPAAQAAASHSGHSRRRGPGQRRHSADPVSLRGARRLDGNILACSRCRHFRCNHRGRDHLRHRGGLAQSAAAAMGARSARRDFSLAADALSRFLGSGTLPRVGCDRDSRDRALCELERTAADSVKNAIAGHLLLGLRDLADRGRAVPDDWLPDAASYGKVEGAPGERNSPCHRDYLHYRHRRTIPLGVSRRISPAPLQQENLRTR